MKKMEPWRKNNAALCAKEPLLKRIERKLKRLGGSRVILGPEILISLMLERGKLMEPKRLVYKHGQPSRCHWNAVKLYLENPDTYKLVIGYALSGDVWRSHSWCLRGADLIETTTKMERYWGIVMDDAGAILQSMVSFNDFYGFKEVQDQAGSTFRSLVDASRAKDEADLKFKKARSEAIDILLPFARGPF